MAAVAAAPSLPRLRSEINVLNTLPAPRSSSPSSSISRSNSNASTRHPDLGEEVANLSLKLVNAINHQTQLDDSLQSARHELEQAREKMAKLEAAAKEHAELVQSGWYVQKDVVSKERQSLLQDVAEERAKRVKAESEMKKGEQELQDLTAALFTEANIMVEKARRDASESIAAVKSEAAASVEVVRKERETAERKNEQLRNQIKDAETLLHSHQAQLQDLKAVVEKISSERGEEESTAQISTAPSTPGIGLQDKFRLLEGANTTPLTPGTEDVTPDHPLKFSHILQPILRTDGVAYREFQELMKQARASLQSTPASRVSSGSFGSINVLGLVTSGSGQSAAAPASPKANATTGPSSPREASSSVPALKDTKVYKRALAEDIEPTLRLDIAPGLSWMARRTVLSSMTNGALNIEPLPTPQYRWRGPVFACALCGEARVGEQYSRKLCFRTSDDADAQRYPLCEQCLNKVRATCDYISFLRMIRDGHWRSETDEDVKSTWEESIRLRERMFWQRLQAGVVPSFTIRESPAVEQRSADRSREDINEEDYTALSVQTTSGDGEREDQQSTPRIEKESFTTVVRADSADPEGAEHNKLRDSLASRSSGSQTIMPSEDGAITPAAEQSKQLSVTIPGSFD